MALGREDEVPDAVEQPAKEEDQDEEEETVPVVCGVGGWEGERRREYQATN